MERRLLVGLGNPDAEHENNRHNIGFMVVDQIARRYGFSPWRRQFKGELAELTHGPLRVSLLKPLTYMNDSGRSVQEAMGFYKLALSDLTVFHDEIELAPAKIKLKVGGSDAGHNGLRSISLHVGNEYKRVRLGVGHPRDWLGQDHPRLKDTVHRHVLSNFTVNDRLWVTTLCQAIAEYLDLLILDQDSRFLNKVHLTMQTRGFSS